MKKPVMALLTACLALACVAGTFADEKQEKKQTKKKAAPIKCVVAGKDINIADAKVVSYRNAKVYVCCDNCKGKVEKDSAPFAAKANHQLVRTKQYRQTKCPLSGGPIDKAQKVRVANQIVKFCCEKCQGKAAEAKGDEQLALIFADAAFEKGFEVVKKKKK
ncbi:MAG: hypothetical protein GY758_13245 [Fuerstiella sp.]|nr:hypothetical protein [Fuerstiella sp.]MCP4511267.1 hypothetical protein [Fuerstiella sp.]